MKKSIKVAIGVLVGIGVLLVVLFIAGLYFAKDSYESYNEGQSTEEMKKQSNE